MARALIYSKDYCPYCIRAKATMDTLGLAYTEINVGSDPEAYQEMVDRTGQRTVPQIFLHIGGSDDFHELLETGALKAVLGMEVQDSGCDSGTCAL